MTQEGAAAVRECVEVLRRTAPRGTLKPLAALARAAKDQVRLQGPKGQTGHSGPDGSTPDSRVRRYDPGRRFLGENIAYGSSRARDIVVDLLVDDGVPGRGHRENLLRKDFFTVGVAVGPHAKYGSMCVIDLTGEQAAASTPSFDCGGVFYDASGRIAAPPPSPHSRSSEEALRAWITNVRSFYAGASSQPSGPRLDSGKAALCTDRRIEREIRADDSIAKALTALQKAGAQVPEDAGPEQAPGLPP